MMDRIMIRNLRADCIVGIEDRERVTRQRILVNVTLECDLSTAARTDRIADTVNYVTIKNGIVELVESSRHFLIEKLAAQIGRLCLADSRIQAVTVCVDKPGALTGAESVAVEMRFDRGRITA